MQKYIVFEGIDGAGKGTVQEGVARILSERGYEVILVREPGGTDTGERIRRVLLDTGKGEVGYRTEALLFAAGRAQLAEEVVRPALEEEKVVLSDRSVYSSLAYQGGARELGIDEVKLINDFALAGTWPDVVILLRADVERGYAREDEHDRISSEGFDLQQKVAGAYDELARIFPENVRVVDANQGIEAVVEEAASIVLDALEAD